MFQKESQTTDGSCPSRDNRVILVHKKPGKIVLGVTLTDGTCLHYGCNGLAQLLVLVALFGIGIKMDIIPPTVTLLLYIVGCKSSDESSSLKLHVTGNLISDWFLAASAFGCYSWKRDQDGHCIT